MNKRVMRLLLILLCYFLQRIYGSSTCPSRRVRVPGGKQFNVIPGSPPVTLGCKQDSKVLQDDKGALYCLARNPKPQKLTKVHCQSLPESCANECGRENPPMVTNRIQGGIFTSPHRYPWVASLQKENGSHFCTASILSPRAILTAAHCFDPPVPTDVTAVVGINDLINENLKGQRLKIKKRIIHPNYINAFKDDSFENDVAILITENIEFNQNVGPICLPQKTFIKEEEETLILGWGMDEGLSILLTDLKIITEPQMDLKEVILSLRNNTSSGMIDSKKEEEFLKELFFRFKEVFSNFDKVFDQKMNFLKPGISKASKNELILEMQVSLKLKLDEKIQDPVYKHRLLDYVLTDAVKIFSEVLLAPNNTENYDLKMICSKCNKNWNWIFNYQERIQDFLFKYTTNKLKEAQSNLMSKEECTKKIKHNHDTQSFLPKSNISTETPSMMCIQPTTGSACSGNSGSPSAVKIDGKFVQVGIASSVFGSPFELPIPCRCGCEDEDGRTPNLYQRVSICMDWIIQQLDNNDANPCKLNYL